MQIKRPVSSQPLPQQAKAVFQGKIFTVYQWEQEMFDGTTAVFEKVGRSDTVNVIPVTEDGSILLTRQEQPGIQAAFWGTPGGRIDPGEEPLAAARRELREETGYTSADMVLWYALQPSGMIDWAVYTFIARTCMKKGDLDLDAGEKITVHKFTFDEFIEKALRQDFRDSEITLSLLRLKDKGKLSDLKRLLRP